MLTIATMVRPFVGEFDLIQRNAIRSWWAITADVILAGDTEAGAAEVAEEYGCRLIPVRRNAEGVKLVNHTIAMIQREKRNDVVLFTGAETIYWEYQLRAVIDSIERKRPEWEAWLAIGQRHDLRHSLGNLSVITRRRFQELNWSGEPHPGFCIEYFLFKGDPWFMLPNFAAGRPGYDNCLVWKALDNGVPVIDVSKVVWAGHQEHGERHRHGELADRNRQMMREECGYAEIRHATWEMDKEGQIHER